MGVTALMTERVTQCHGVTAAHTYYAEGVGDGRGGRGREEEEEEGALNGRAV